MGLNTDFVLDEWIPALRSGEYAQGSGRLHTADGAFCCLGVACDLLIKQGMLPPWEDAPADYGEGVKVVRSSDGYLEANYLPEMASRHLGMGRVGSVDADDWGDGGVQLEIGNGLYMSLTDANDGGRTFAEIADALEALATGA